MKRIPMTMRLPPALHEQIRARAEIMGRSLTHETEVLLEHALIAEETMGSKAWRLGTMATLIFANVVNNWIGLEDKDKPAEPLDDPSIYREGLTNVIAVLAESQPDLDGLFDAVRDRIRQRRTRRRPADQSLRAAADAAIGEMQREIERSQ